MRKKIAKPLDNADEINEKKAAENRKNSKAATKKKQKEDMKRASDKMLMELAAKMPAGPGKKFIKDNMILDELHAEKLKIARAIGAKRKEMRGDKIDLACLDRVRKLREMEPDDVAAKKATEALYEQQLGLPLSGGQENLLSELSKKREADKASIVQASGGDTGKEVGSGSTGIPERNESMEEDGEASTPPASTIAAAAALH